MLNKALTLVSIICCIYSISAAPITEDANVKEGMSSAFKNGFSVFGAAASTGARAPMPNRKDARAFSHYSAAVPRPIGGGKPSLSEQYRIHHYVPLTPVVVPPEHSTISGRMTPEDAAERYVPHPPLQYTTDEMFHTGKSG